MSRPRFDPTINLGHVLTAVAFVATLTGSWYLQDYRLSRLESQVERLSTIVIDNARIDERLKDHSRRLDWLEMKR